MMKSISSGTSFLYCKECIDGDKMKTYCRFCLPHSFRLGVGDFGGEI